MTLRFLLFTFLLLSLFSCMQDKTEKQSQKSIDKLDSLHSHFNDLELEKQIYQLDKDTISIVAFGHVYGLLYHEDVFEQLIEKVNEQNPDYIWILGDVVFNNTEDEWNYLLEKYQEFTSKRFHAGGNHDMNYHYERYHGSSENRWEAESRYLSKIGYRYLTIEDDNANYMLLNMNDSISRISDYLDTMKAEMNPEKQSILFTHHSTWHPNQSEAEDPKTWVKKSFSRDSILPLLNDFDFLIYGDWSEGFYFKDVKINGKKYKVMDVGNLNEGDPLYITSIKLTKDSLWAKPINIPIAESSSWFN